MAKQSLASAYVQIIPSADGISGKLAEVMGGEATAAGKISGKSLGSALVGSLTKVVAAAGIGKMLQSAFTGGTAFESAMAKVGTIADTAKVPLESLSSQVLQVSGDMHIGANEIAEAAYQAISAGQDTGNAVAFAGHASMLATAGFAGLWSSVEAGTGALSLASSGADKFNGVLQQMQADSGATQTAYDTMTDTMAYKLDGVKTNAQNLGTALFDAVSGRLGEGVALAGDYLQTLSESVQQNGIAGLAEGLAAVFTDLTTNVGPQLLQTGTALLGKLGDGLVTGIPQLLAQALPVAASLASGLRENAGQLVDAGIQFILNLATGLMNGLPTMIAYLPGIVSDIAGIINDNAPKLLVAGVQLIVTLGQGLIQAIPALVENIPQILMAVANVITAFNWLNLGGNIIKLLGDGIKGMKGALTSGFKSVLDGGINYIKSLPAKFIEWGKDMIMGLVKGITGSVGAVVGAVKNVASTIATYIHFSRPDVGPLRLYEQWMPDFMSGLAKGIRDNLWMVEDAADVLALTTAQPMQLQVAGVLRGNQQTAAASWQPQPGVAYQQTNNFYTHDSLSESELTREAEDMMNRLRWGIP